MKRMLTVFTLLFFFSVANAQQPAQKDAWKNTRDGNQSFKAGNFVQAEKHYREAVHSDTNKVVANYNLGNSLYRQRKYDDASRAYADGLNTKNADSLAKGYHNLGNALLQEKKYQESINAYKQSLKLNPKDENTRYNLAYAESKLKQNQPPPKNNSNNNNNKDKSKGDDKNKPDKDNKNNRNDNKNDQADKPKQDDKAMSPDEAQRLLDALKDAENKTRQKMNQKNGGAQNALEKDW